MELDLQCEREQRATVHTLLWEINGQGYVRHNECTCNSCPLDAYTRRWPSTFELQDAGAASNVPHGDPEEPPTKAFSFFA